MVNKMPYTDREKEVPEASSIHIDLGEEFPPSYAKNAWPPSLGGFLPFLFSIHVSRIQNP